jgi:hypothetical protein
MSRLLIQYLNMQTYEMYLFTVGKSNQISSCLSWALKTYNMTTWLWNWGQGYKPSSRQTCTPLLLNFLVTDQEGELSSLCVLGIDLHCCFTQSKVLLPQAILFMPFGFIAPKILNYLSILSVPDEGYSRNASFYYYHWIDTGGLIWFIRYIITEIYSS